MKSSIFAIGLLIFPILPALAQEQTATIVASTSDNVLRAGTPIALRMVEHLTTKGKDLKEGYRFHLEVAEAVTLNGVTVIPAGSPAIGEVTFVKNKGMWGKSGKINGRILYLQANGRQVRLSGQIEDKGKAGTAGVVGAAVLLPVAGFFVTGTSAEIPVGTDVKGFLDEDLTVAFAPAEETVVMPAAAPAPIGN